MEDIGGRSRLVIVCDDVQAAIVEMKTFLVDIMLF
jgi:hypothetical protein